ncbi:uncharacterized protein LOC126573071 [Anopheles aquasalis]|uniref:uncharacterized protein LOC126573071 n=1 Tax=Anopheles aquasalis TaxID=42839 RepID=UPI00215AB14A|nr:uncharacterized protein LOC126573071 [Anopheles aquasalis]
MFSVGKIAFESCVRVFVIVTRDDCCLKSSLSAGSERAGEFSSAVPSVKVPGVCSGMFDSSPPLACRYFPMRFRKLQDNSNTVIAVQEAINVGLGSDLNPAYVRKRHKSQIPVRWRSEVEHNRGWLQRTGISMRTRGIVEYRKQLDSVLSSDCCANKSVDRMKSTAGPR